MLTSILSLILPFIKVESIRENIPEEYVVNLPAVIIGQRPDPVTNIEAVHSTTANLAVADINWWLLLYLAGVIITLLYFIQKSIKLYALKRRSIRSKIDGYNLITVPNSKDAFSFWNTIYLGDKIDSSEKEQILIHEIVHLKEKHSLDLLWFEILKIIFWFNPLVYIYQSRINTLHEFIADAKSVNTLGRRKYYEQLLNTVFDTEKIEFINQFFNQSLLKKRIQMLQKSKSKEIVKFKYLAILPILVLMVVFSSFSEKEKSFSPISADNTFELIDTTDNALKKKFEKELLEMIENKASFKDIKESFSLKRDGNKISKENYLRAQVFTEYVIKAESKKKEEKGELLPGDAILNQKLLEKIGVSYDESISSKQNTEKENIAKEESNLESKIAIAETIEQTIEKPKQLVIDSTKKEITFDKVDKAPTSKACMTLTDSKEMKKCISQEIKNFVNANFNIGDMRKYAQPEVNRIYVKFKIDPTGSVTEVQARASAKELEQEAIRVVSAIPQMIPGEVNGEKVTVLYTLPIVFYIPVDQNSTETENQTEKKQSNSEIAVLTETIPDEFDHDIESGYYLVTNIFKSKSRFEKTINNFKKVGLPAQGFQNPVDNYYYLHLGKYNELSLAKELLFNNINGRYHGDIYILKINGE
ncbi:hypothetical protein GCM10022258_22910 [Aquimarina gracilis]